MDEPLFLSATSFLQMLHKNLKGIIFFIPYSSISILQKHIAFCSHAGLPNILSYIWKFSTNIGITLCFSLQEHSKVEVYSIPTTPATSQDLGFVTSSASPAFIPSEGEIVYPTTGSTEQEPALTIVNLPRHSYRKIGLPV